MGGRGNSGAGGGNGRAQRQTSDKYGQDTANDAGDLSDPKQAAKAQGITGADVTHFESGARATRAALAATSPGDALPAFRAAVAAHERKYGRGAARAYARGGYWSLLRVLRAGIAVYNIATGAGSSPVVQSANTAILASYWLAR